MVFRDYFLGSQQGSWGIPFHRSSQLQTHGSDPSLLRKSILCSRRGERAVFLLPELYKCQLLILLFAAKTEVACCSQLPLSGGEEWELGRWRGCSQQLPSLPRPGVQVSGRLRCVASGHSVWDWDAVKSFGINSVWAFETNAGLHCRVLFCSLFWRWMTFLKDLPVTMPLDISVSRGLMHAPCGMSFSARAHTEISLFPANVIF